MFSFSLIFAPLDAIDRALKFHEEGETFFFYTNITLAICTAAFCAALILAAIFQIKKRVLLDIDGIKIIGLHNAHCPWKSIKSMIIERCP